MSTIRLPQNPGIDGLASQLTNAEVALIQNLAGLAYQNGDMLYYNTGAFQRLPIGSNTDVMTVTAGLPSWQAASAGSGDVSSNTSSSVDSEIALFSGTGGKTIKRATGTGLAKITSGVLSTASAGTDYLSPAGTEAVSNKTIGTTNTVTLFDSLFTLQDNGDATKQLQFQLSGISVATTRTLTIQDLSGTIALTANKLSVFAATTSAELAGVISDEVGSGALMFGTSPRVTTEISPASNDGAALGTTSLSWADLFLASGGVINWNNGDVTITHASNLLTFGGASSGYSFDAVIQPATNDAAALGSTSLKWSDLFLASGAIINFNSGDVTITHTADTLTVAGGNFIISSPGTVAGSAVTIDGVQTLTNKNITQREGTTTSTASLTIDADATDIHTVTALAAGLTINDPSGSPTQGKNLVIRIKDNGTARALTWNSIFKPIGVTLPTTTVISKLLYIGMKYNSTSSQWDVLAVAQEA